MSLVPKTRNKKADKPTDKDGTKNPPVATQTSAADPRGVVSNPVTREKKPTVKKESSTTLGVTVTDSLGYKLAALPIANKDKELVANLLADELGIKDLDRFMREVHRTDVPTPKT